MLKAKGEGSREVVLHNFLLQYRSTLHSALGKKFTAEVLMDRKVRTVHEAILPKKTLPDRRRYTQKSGFAVNTRLHSWLPTGPPVESCDCHKLAWELDAEVGKYKWVHHHNQFRLMLAEPTYDRCCSSLYSLLDRFILIHVLGLGLRLKIRFQFQCVQLEQRRSLPVSTSIHLRRPTDELSRMGDGRRKIITFSNFQYFFSK